MLLLIFCYSCADCIICQLHEIHEFCVLKFNQMQEFHYISEKQMGIIIQKTFHDFPGINTWVFKFSQYPFSAKDQYSLMIQVLLLP